MSHAASPRPEAEAEAEIEAKAAVEEQQQQQPAPAKFDHLRPDAQDNRDLDLDVILDVSVTLSLEVGRIRMPIRELLKLNPGAILDLGRPASEPLDVYVNGTLVARGEVVVINERFGVRLTEVVSPVERISKLR